MVHLSRKTQKSAGTAEAPKPKTSEKSKQKTKKSKGFVLPSQAEIMKNPMKYISVAVKQFQSLGEQVEKQGEAIVQIAKHIQDSDEKLAPLVNVIEQAKAAREQAPQGPNPMPQGMGGMGALMQFLPALLGGGGGDNEMASLGKDLIKAQIESIKASAIARQAEGTILSKIGQEVLTRMASREIRKTVQ